MNVKQCQGRTFHANVNEMNSRNLKSFFVSRNDKKENLVTLDITQMTVTSLSLNLNASLLYSVL